METNIPYIIQGGSFHDYRGELQFVNDFKLNDIKRFYIMNHSDTSIIRAWHGHKYEKKYFFVLNGSFLINCVKIDNWENPSINLKTFSHILTKSENKLLCIPAGYANGLKALDKNSSLLILSNFTLDESLNDDYRYDKNLWFNWANY